MLFNSYKFLFLFLPIVLILYSVSEKYYNGKYGKTILLTASFAFAACSGLIGFTVLLVSIAVNYYLGESIRKCQSKGKSILSIGIVFNVAMLAAFKYFPDMAGFFMDRNSALFRITLPLGISFYTFQQIAFLTDTYRRETEHCSLVEYGLFVSFFPKLVQGPITRYGDFMPQIRNLEKKNLSAVNFSNGLYLFAIGLSKKVLVADQFGKIVDFGYGHIAGLNQFEAILTILAYTFQIYFDFSGYCDMACGIARMFGIELPQNFNSPYKARNISDFWKRWHITLTSFLTHYIYIPLGGNRKGIVRTYLNILIVFLVSGLWHGSGITFLVWGFLHGAASVFYRLFRKQYDKMPIVLQWLLTFLFINITWVFFRAENISGAAAILKAAVCAGGTFTINAELTETLLQPTLVSIASRVLTLPVVSVLGIIAALLAVLVLKNSEQKAKVFCFTAWQWIQTYLLLILSLLSVSGVSTFLYSNF